MKNNKITVIIPVYNADKALLDNALESVKSQIVTPEVVLLVVKDGSDDHKLVKELDFGDLKSKIVNHKEGTSFAEQMNKGVSECDTEWFIFLEQDDELSKIWIKNVIKYREVYDDINIFLPLIVDVGPTGKFAGTSNEPVWAAEFSDVMGNLDIDSLLKHENFNFDGMCMQKDAYEEFGGIKNSIKLTFMYEFLLRMTFKSNKTMVIPKLGYKHVNMREGGLFSNYKEELTPDEARWWLATAKREYYHTKDRSIVYEKL
tara:strand:- start:7327 stop:8103 length:777 start_codon:yes stop_codon:yes gene_type:complete